jgi:hypothetical protein
MSWSLPTLKIDGCHLCGPSPLRSPPASDLAQYDRRPALGTSIGRGSKVVATVETSASYKISCAEPLLEPCNGRDGKHRYGEPAWRDDPIRLSCHPPVGPKSNAKVIEIRVTSTDGKVINSAGVIGSVRPALDIWCICTLGKLFMNADHDAPTAPH